jgi:membrane protein involved in colicin uptake
MSAMRIPKYTAGMFKKKMPRFGAPGIKMPRIPKPPKPRIKKFDGGGGVEEEVIISPEAGKKEYAELFAKSERNRKERELQKSKDFVNRYIAESKKAEDAKAKEKLKKDEMRKQFDAYMEERKKQEEAGVSEFMRQMKRGVRTARSGGVMKSSCCRGDGIAKRGKTRGKFV